MKKSIAKLKAEGWEIPEDFKEKIEAKKSTSRFNDAADSIAESMGKIVEITKNLKSGDDRLKGLLNEHLAINAKLIKQLEQLSKNSWQKIDFAVIRKNGFIDHVITTRVK